MNIENVVEHIVTLENIIDERDDWYSAFNLYSIKLDIVNKYLELDKDSVEAISEIQDKQEKARKLLEGTEKELFEFSGVSSVQQGRELLISLKTMLNYYYEKFSVSFAEEINMNDKSKEDILKVAENLIRNRIDG